MHAAVDPPAVIATLRYLLTVAVADPQSRIREAVLTCLAPRTDPYLAHVELVQIICVCLRDPHVQVCAAALSLAGRLMARNPSVVVPALWRVLIQLTHEVQVSTNPTAQAEAARLLSILIGAARA